jgi:uncharacterized protein (TIGR02145 family)
MKAPLLIVMVLLILTSCEEENKPPSCNITSPAHNSIFRIGDVIEIAVGAVDKDGDIMEVTIYLNNSVVAGLKSLPYIVGVSTEAFGTGTYVIRAMARDDGGLKASDEIEVRVNPLDVPFVYTIGISSITSVSMNSSGNVLSDGGVPVVERGFCWGMEQDPTLLDPHVVASGQGIGTFEAVISGLECSTNYYFRAYATNSVGTGYGESIAFTTGYLPSVITSPVTEKTATTAQCGGTVMEFCGFPVLARGVCWGTSHDPDITGMKTDEGGGTGSFVSTITDLETGVLYYVRAYATVDEGTVYGDEITLRTWDNSEVVDVDGNSYSTVLIGDQIWMSENLGVTRYADELPIPLVEDVDQWDALDYDAMAYCWYYNDSTVFAADYGALYTWSAAMKGAASSYNIPSGVQGVCPDGWHLPSNNEWAILVDYLGGEEVAGGKLKETGILHWEYPNTDASNESGFTALPGGYRSSSGGFYRQGNIGSWISSSNYAYYYIDPERAYVVRLYNDHEYIRFNGSSTEYGSSVRCLKD